MTAARFSFFVLLLLLLSVAARGISSAQAPPGQFADPDRQALYDQLVRELRCLVCQNQNLADSNAELAHDLRRKTHDMVARGQSYEQVVEYMVARYGDFVLYRPPLKPVTIALWGLPFVGLLVIVIVALFRLRRNAAASSIVLSDKEQAAAAQLLDDRRKLP